MVFRRSGVIMFYNLGPPYGATISMDLYGFFMDLVS